MTKEHLLKIIDEVEANKEVITPRDAHNLVKKKFKECTPPCKKLSDKLKDPVTWADNKTESLKQLRQSVREEEI